MYGAIYRMQAYDAKVAPARVQTDITALVTDMKDNFADAVVSLVSMETLVKQLLDESGVPTIMYPSFLSFARRLWSLQRREIGGESLCQEAALWIALWVARGLPQAVLQAIRTDVFNIEPPLAP